MPNALPHLPTGISPASIVAESSQEAPHTTITSYAMHPSSQWHVSSDMRMKTYATYHLAGTAKRFSNQKIGYTYIYTRNAKSKCMAILTNTIILTRILLVDGFQDRAWDSHLQLHGKWDLGIATNYHQVLRTQCFPPPSTCPAVSAADDHRCLFNTDKGQMPIWFSPTAKQVERHHFHCFQYFNVSVLWLAMHRY